MKKLIPALLVLAVLLGIGFAVSPKDSLQGSFKNVSQETPAVQSVGISPRGELQFVLPGDFSRTQINENQELLELWINNENVFSGSPQDLNIQSVVMSGGTTMFNGFKLPDGQVQVKLCYQDKCLERSLEN